MPVTKEIIKPSNEEISNTGNILEVIDGITYINGIMIVNKTYSIPKDYYPKNTHTTISKNTLQCETCLVNEVYDAYIEMKKDAQNEGLNIWIQSGYRSYNYQKELFDSYVSRDGVEKSEKYSAKPGYSEHQTGYAFDLNTIDDSFANTKEGIWINNNAYKYGFILRYPKNKEEITGYKYESWHLRYVGKDLAKILYNNGNWITLEEYLGITSKYE